MPLRSSAGRRPGLIAAAILIGGVALAAWLRSGGDEFDTSGRRERVDPSPAAERAGALEPQLESRSRPEQPAGTEAAAPGEAHPPVAHTETDVPAPASREFLRAAIADFLSRHPDRRPLSEGELQAVIDTMLRARTIYAEIHDLGSAPEHAERVAALHAEAERVWSVSREILGIPAGMLPPGSRFGRGTAAEE